MYVVNDYQLKTIEENTYVFSDSKALKISHPVLRQILTDLRLSPRYEVSEETLSTYSETYNINLDTLKQILIDKLDVLRPVALRQFSTIYIDSDDELVTRLLNDTFSTRHQVQLISSIDTCAPGSIIIFYRNNYSNTDFNSIYSMLPDNVYLITAGVMHKILVIDNLYFNHCGLPTHQSNIHQLTAFLRTDLPASKDNWLLFYRSLLHNAQDQFPDPELNACQQAFVAYALYQFTNQYTNFWKAPMVLDKINWFWHVDLTSFHVHQEVAIHSAFSEYDMNINHLNLNHLELA